MAGDASGDIDARLARLAARRAASAGPNRRRATKRPARIGRILAAGLSSSAFFSVIAALAAQSPAAGTTVATAPPPVAWNPDRLPVTPPALPAGGRPRVVVKVVHHPTATVHAKGPTPSTGPPSATLRPATVTTGTSAPVPETTPPPAATAPTTTPPATTVPPSTVPPTTAPPARKAPTTTSPPAKAPPTTPPTTKAPTTTTTCSRRRHRPGHRRARDRGAPDRGPGRRLLDREPDACDGHDRASGGRRRARGPRRVGARGDRAARTVLEPLPPRQRARDAPRARRRMGRREPGDAAGRSRVPPICTARRQDCSIRRSSTRSSAPATTGRSSSWSSKGIASAPDLRASPHAGSAGSRSTSTRRVCELPPGCGSISAGSARVSRPTSCHAGWSTGAPGPRS